MNKSDLIASVAARTGLSRRRAEDAVNATIDSITSSLARGEKVSISSFGTFEKRKRAARTARNPQTGATVKIRATSAPAFRASQSFKDAVAGMRRGGRRR